jgi:hypothetical protein
MKIEMSGCFDAPAVLPTPEARAFKCPLNRTLMGFRAGLDVSEKKRFSCYCWESIVRSYEFCLDRLVYALEASHLRSLVRRYE